MLILTDNITSKALMLAELQCDSEIQDWLGNILDPAEVDLIQAVDAVKARDNSELAYYGLSIRRITNLRPRYIPDVDSLAIDLGATAITVSEECSLADIVSALYYVDPERGEKYLWEIGKQKMQDTTHAKVTRWTEYRTPSGVVYVYKDVTLTPHEKRVITKIISMWRGHMRPDWETFESMRAHPMNSFADATLVPVMHNTL